VSHWTLDRHITGVLRSGHYNIHALRHICPVLTLDTATKMITHSVV